jgi:ribosomal protein L29
MAKKSVTTKKSATTADKSQSFAARDLRTKSPDELSKLLETAHADLLEFQKMHAAGDLANPQVLRKARRDVARIKTIHTEVINASKEAA